MNNILDTKVKRNSYMVIQGWMLTDLKLKGNELMVYAIVYGFSKDADDQWFTGSLQYIVDWTNSTKRTVLTCLQSLESKGFIEKQDIYLNNVKFCKYRATNVSMVVNNLQGGIEKISPPSEKISIGGSENSSPNNIDLNNLNNNLDNNKRTRFIPPAFEEVKSYCSERGNNVNPEQFINYYSSNGWKVGKNSMKDWKAAVRTWESRESSKPKIEIVNNDLDLTFTHEADSNKKEGFETFKRYLSSKLNRSLTAAEEKIIKETIHNDPTDFISEICDILNNKNLKNFKDYIDNYAQESMKHFENMI